MSDRQIGGPVAKNLPGLKKSTHIGEIPMNIDLLILGQYRGKMISQELYHKIIRNEYKTIYYPRRD